jgi:hypothetical protein
MLKPHSLAALTAACAAFSSSTVAAAERLPAFPHLGDDLSAKPRHHVLVNELRLGGLQIRLEKTRLTELRRRFPPLKIRTQGDASEAEAWVCFTVGNGANRFQVWPSSGELMGGKFIDGVIAQAGQRWSPRDCPRIEVGRGPMELDNRVWIGTAKADLLKRLGPPTGTADGVMIYDYEVAFRESKAGACAVGGRLAFELLRDRVARLAATKDTAC